MRDGSPTRWELPKAGADGLSPNPTGSGENCFRVIKNELPPCVLCPRQREGTDLARVLGCGSGAWVFSVSNLLIRPQVGPFSPSEGSFGSNTVIKHLCWAGWTLTWGSPARWEPGLRNHQAGTPPGSQCEAQGGPSLQGCRTAQNRLCWREGSVVVPPKRGPLAVCAEKPNFHCVLVLIR